MDAWKERGTVYLLHFDRPFKHAKHYLGWTANLADRIARHRGEKERDGRGSRLVEVAREAGIGFLIMRTWEGDRYLERRMKGRGLGELCPKCCASASKRGTLRGVLGAEETYRYSAPHPLDVNVLTRKREQTDTRPLNSAERLAVLRHGVRIYKKSRRGQ